MRYNLDGVVTRGMTAAADLSVCQQLGPTCAQSLAAPHVNQMCQPVFTDILANKLPNAQFIPPRTDSRCKLYSMQEESMGSLRAR